MSVTQSGTVSQSDRIVLADDHPLFRAALREAVRRLSSDIETLDASSLAETRATLKDAPASLVCLDLHMSDSSGFLGLTELRRSFPAIPVVVVSACQTPGIAHRALEFGASGFIPKTADLDTMCEALDAVRQGEVWIPEDSSEPENDEALEAAARIASLTPAQLRVLEGLASGKLNKQIAYEMDVSIATVKAHVTAIFRKLGVINRTQAVLLAQSLFVDAGEQSA